MLPSELLRYKIVKNEYIYPKFAEINYDNLFVADSLIEIYKKNIGKKVKDLEDEIKDFQNLAEEYGYDFKFLRGLKALLDRKLILEEDNIDKNQVIKIRNEIFTTANLIYKGFVLNEEERNRVLKEVSEKLGIDISEIEKIFKLIYDDEITIKDFPNLKAEELLKEYNLSLLQTLLFRCKKLYADINASGTHLKKFLWNVKKLGLLYIAEKSHIGLNLAIDGPVSVIKQIERYGTRLAKLFPLILQFKYWKIRAYITRKIRSKKADKRVYKFEISKEYEHIFPKFTETEVTYDSQVEETFAKRFYTIEGEWQIIREPEPILIENMIFIPDFALVKGNKKVYLEIMGFWTEDYLKRKIEKISKVKDINIILAIDSSLGKFNIENPSVTIIHYDKKISVIDIVKVLKKFE